MKADGAWKELKDAGEEEEGEPEAVEREDGDSGPGLQAQSQSQELQAKARAHGSTHCHLGGGHNQECQQNDGGRSGSHKWDGVERVIEIQAQSMAATGGRIGGQARVVKERQTQTS